MIAGLYFGYKAAQSGHQSVSSFARQDPGGTYIASVFWPVMLLFHIPIPAAKWAFNLVHNFIKRKVEKEFAEKQAKIEADKYLKEVDDAMKFPTIQVRVDERSYPDYEEDDIDDDMEDVYTSRPLR